MLKEGEIRFVRDRKTKTNTTVWTVLYEKRVVWINKVHDSPKDFRYVVYDMECRRKGLSQNRFLHLLIPYSGGSVNTKRSGPDFFRNKTEWENIAVENPKKYEPTCNRREKTKKRGPKKSKRDREDSSEFRESEDTEQRKKPKEDAVDANANGLKLEQLQNLAFKIEVKDGNLLFHLPLSIMNAMNK